MKALWALPFVIVAACSKREPTPTPPPLAPPARSIPAATPMLNAPAPRDLPVGVSAPVHDLLKRCDGGEALACALAGRLFSAGLGVPDDNVFAAKLYAKGCTEKAFDGCVGLARASFEGVGAGLDANAGASMLRAACDRGGADACADLGARMNEGRGIAYDAAAGLALLQKACEHGSLAGCRALVDAPAHPIDLAPEAVEHWKEKATKAAENACGMGWGAGCEYLVNHSASTEETVAAAKRACLAIAPAASFGCSGVGADETVILQQACDGGALERCIDLAFAGANGGDRSPAGRARFDELVTKACRAGSPRGCWALGVAPKAEAILHDACAAGEVASCRPTHRDLTTRTDAERQFGCEHDSAIDCRELAERRPFADAKTLLERACPDVPRRSDARDVDAIACGRLGDAYRSGDGEPRDAARAAVLFRRACFAGGRLNERGVGCASLAEMYDLGEGVPKDRGRATSLYAGLCYAQEDQCGPFVARGGKKR